MYDARKMTAKARQAASDRFLKQVDPSGDLRRKDPAEAARRADAARKLFYTRLAYQSAATRVRRKKSPGDCTM
jgi:hypothetical protein